MMSVTEAVRRRISTRAFLPTPITGADLSDLLALAQRAPSGGNLQPWRTIAVSGSARAEIVAIAQQALGDNPLAPAITDRPVYPDFKLVDPVYDQRRRRVGEMMYAAMRIPREDRAGRIAWFARNYTFFDAPVGLFFVIDTRMGHGQWAHMGMYLQTIALLAEERGWGTCMQECWARLRAELHAHFRLGEHEMIYCGMALGHPDPDAPVNSLYSERAAPDEVVSLRGF